MMQRSLGAFFILLGLSLHQASPAHADEQSERFYNADKSQYAYWVHTGEGPQSRFQMIWHVGDQELRGLEFNFVADVDFRPDGKQIVYSASRTREDGRLVFFEVFQSGDGSIQGPEFDHASRARYTSDSASVVYRVHNFAGNYQIVQSDVKGATLFSGREYGFVFPFQVSPVGQRWVYWVEKKKRGPYAVVLADGRGESEGPEFAGLWDDPKYSPAGYPTFSEDGKHFYYRAIQENVGPVLVMDNVIQPEPPGDGG